MKLGSDQKELAGIYLVGVRLALANYTSAVLSRTQKGIDMLVYNPASNNALAIQVKTAFDEQDIRTANFDNEEEFKKADFVFHVFVRFDKTLDEKNAKLYFLSGKDVKCELEHSYKVWLEGKHRKPLDQLEHFKNMCIRDVFLQPYEGKFENLKRELE